MSKDQNSRPLPSLEDLGWHNFFKPFMTPYTEKGMIPARVARQDKGRYTVYSSSGRYPAEISGRLRHEAVSRSQLPAVGDWVALHTSPESERAMIHAVLERRSRISRKEAGSRTSEQVLCANVETAFIVSSLTGERGFVLRRIERYLTIALESGIDPVIVLNKSDLCDNTEEHAARTEEIAMGAPVYAVSALTGAGMDGVSTHLGKGKTAVLLGPSGVGKSTLINTIMGSEVVKTGGIRADDGRGRHTTTWRELIVMPEHGLIVDTPGLRELQLWAEEDALDGSFSEISDLASQCRFRDCTHSGEPGCAVQAAVDAGTLEAARLESYHMQQAELRYLERRRDQNANRIEQAKWKSIHKSVKTLDKISPKRKWMKN